MKSFEQSLSEKVVVTGYCWLWTAATTSDDHLAYGSVWNGTKTTVAHRWVYENLVGPIAPRHDLDHLCRVRLCVNPDHLQPVTRAVNLQRGRHSLKGVTALCRRGHDVSKPEHQHMIQRGAESGTH